MDERKELVGMLIDKLNEAEEKGWKLLECLGEAVEIANDIEGEIRSCVAGQLEAYTIGNIQAFLTEDNDYQSGNLSNLKKIINRQSKEEEY